MRTTIESGTTLSHYRVLSPLGAGGMGEVYKAHDNTLERTVALKILPPDLVKNDERVRRFVQEAKSASSLNHPHIVTIHEIGEARLSANGSEDASAPALHYIAMELIDGVTLKRKIHDADTDLRTLLSYLAQAADGLAKAHAAGIVHRDLKPENIMVSRDGFAKVLDFGLAKLNVKKSAPDGQTQATAVRDETREGALLGTVAYMSPEQIQGKPVDHRTDIFALGSILYEVATRRRPFEADSDVDVMHKILHDKPQPVDEINAEVPAELRRMIRRCMAKEPEKRFQSMKDIALELTEIVDEFDQLSISSSTRGSSTPSASGILDAPPHRRLWAFAAVIGVIALAAIGFAVMQWRAARSKIEPVSYGSMKVQRLTSSQDVTGATVSPDGKYVAYTRFDDQGHSLWMRQVATGSDVQVMPPSQTRYSGIKFAPSGDYLYYSRVDDAEGPTYAWLYSVPTLGGTPRKLLFDVDTPVAFSPDGKQIAFGRGFPEKNENGLIVANADGTGERTVARFPRYQPPSSPAWAPDGKKVIFTVADISRGWSMYPLEIDVVTGAKRRVGDKRWFDVHDPSFTPDGLAIVMGAVDADTARSQIWLQPYPDGSAVHVTNDLNDYGVVSITSDGNSVLAVQSQRDTNLLLAPGGDAAVTPFTATPNQRISDVAVAANGAVTYAFESGNSSQIAIVDGPGAPPRVLTREGDNFNTSITADGRTVVFQSERGTDPPHIFAVDADGSNVRQLTKGDGEVNSTISPDGRMLLYMRVIDQSLWLVAVPGGTPRRLSASINSNTAFSTDGKYVAFLEWRARGGRLGNNLVVLPVEGGPPVADLPSAGGRALRWHPKENGVTFARNTGRFSNLFLQPLAGGEPKQLTKFRQGRISSYDWTSEGKLILSSGETRSDVVMITDWRSREK